MIYTEKYDNELSTFPIYQLYPELIPLIGTDINKVNKHFLFIGESHYLPKEREDVHTNIELWYDDRVNLDETERYWLSTRKLISTGVNQKYKSKAHSIYMNIEKSLIDSGLNPELQDNMFRYCSFMNFFQRPACPGVSIKDSHIDRQTAFEALCHVAATVKPDALIFVSRMAYNVYDWYKTNTDQALKLPYHVVPHPGSTWWNRKSSKYLNEKKEQQTGREHLLQILTKFN